MSVAGILTVGRADTIGDIQSRQFHGDTLKIDGKLPADTLATLLQRRQQLLGYADNPDESIIPVTYNNDSTIDGFYTVDSVEVGVGQPHSWPYSIQLTRVPGYAAPLFESIMLGAVRIDSGHSPEVTSGSEISWHAVPGGTLSYGLPIANSEEDRTAADGTIKFFYMDPTSGGSFHNAKPRWTCPPASWYQGAAKIEVGTTLATVVGRQIPNLPANWRLSNGLVRVVPNGVSLDVSHYDGTQWDTAKSFTIGFYDNGSLGDKHIAHNSLNQVAILRNSPEECVIRLSYTSHYVISHVQQDVTVDLALRRGSRTVRATMQVYGEAVAGATPVVFRTTAEAATTLFGGLRATSNDAAGNRYIISGAAIGGKDLARGSVHSNQSLKGMFGIGSEINGSGSTGENDAQKQIYQYYAADTEQVVVAGR